MHKRATYDLAIGLTLRELHEERRPMRSKVAQALEITELAVTRIETGEERLSAGGVILLLKLFDLSWDEFMLRVESNLGKAEAEII